MIGIDTLHLKTKGIIPKSRLKDIGINTGWNVYYPKGNVTRGYARYEIRIGNVVIKHTVENHHFWIEIDSCGGFLHHNSMIPIKDEHVLPFMDKLEKLLVEHTGVELLTPLSESEVTRLDAKRDFFVGDNMVDYLTNLCKLRCPRHQTTTRGNGTTIEVSNSSRVMKIYNRYLNCNKKEKSIEETEMSKGMLRFEVVCKAAELRRQLGVESPTLGSMFKSSVTEELLTKYLQLLNLLDLRISTEGDLLNVLADLCGATKAHHILAYIRARHNNRAKDFPRSTRYDYEKLLKAAGIAPVIGTKHLPPLNKPLEDRETVKVRSNVETKHQPHKRYDMNANLPSNSIKGGRQGKQITLDGSELAIRPSQFQIDGFVSRKIRL